MTKTNPIIILGSSRRDGNTRNAIASVVGEHTATLVDLTDLEISYFDYEGKNKHDDFIPLIEKMVTHKKIVLATPVYWYTMSGQMKTFLDRWSDLITTRKDLGRQLAGKELYLISSFAGEKPLAFEIPFSETAAYLDMHYKNCYYHYSGGQEEHRLKNNDRAQKFAASLWGA